MSTFLATTSALPSNADAPIYYIHFDDDALFTRSLSLSLCHSLSNWSGYYIFAGIHHQTKRMLGDDGHRQRFRLSTNRECRVHYIWSRSISNSTRYFSRSPGLLFLLLLLFVQHAVCAPNVRHMASRPVSRRARTRHTISVRCCACRVVFWSGRQEYWIGGTDSICYSELHLFIKHQIGHTIVVLHGSLDLHKEHSNNK